MVWDDPSGKGGPGMTDNHRHLLEVFFIKSDTSNYFGHWKYDAKAVLFRHYQSFRRAVQLGVLRVRPFKTEYAADGKTEFKFPPDVNQPSKGPVLPVGTVWIKPISTISFMTSDKGANHSAPALKTKADAISLRTARFS